MARDRFERMGESIPVKSPRDIVSQFRDVLKDLNETARELSKDNHVDGQEETWADIWG